MLHDHTKENQNSSQTKHKTYEIEMKSKPRRRQGGKGLLSHSISVQSLKNPWFKSYPRKEREEEQEGREKETHGRKGGSAWTKRGREERESGWEIFKPTNSSTKRLNYP